MKDEDLLPRNDCSRRIIHLDMDAFYASVEMRDHPELRGKAVVIAQDPRLHGGHGVIATANYRARKYGVGSAMPAIKAIQQIPKEELVFVDPDFAKYHAVSDQVHAIMHEVTDQIETVALDEAYLDVTQNKLQRSSVIELGCYMQQKIYAELQLTCSFGASYNKFLAKMGSEYAKPFGRTVILPQEARAFLAKQDIKEFPGIGKKTQAALRDLGINNGADLRAFGTRKLLEKFKKAGYYMAMHAYGIDLSPVRSTRQRKSLGKERTFEPEIYDPAQAQTLLRQYCGEIAQSLQARGLVARVLVLKLRDRDFNTITRRQRLPAASNKAADFYPVAKELLDREPEFIENGLRLLGVSGGDLSGARYEEISLFPTDE
ncbi:MAG: DNA polymerase IV [Lactobacillus porci]|nr:DNA polymerase IV [Lactobacillus porci]